jgi:arylsulfatase A-like enzyme
MQDYLACVESVDDHVGRVLDYLEKNGLDNNTVIIYTSDQGFYLGEHGWFDKRFIYEESLRMPLMIKYPGVIKNGTRSKAMVQNLDFAPTILDIAGVEIPEDMQGVSMLPVFDGSVPEDWRNSIYYHYYEYPSIHMAKRHYGIRTEKYTLVHFYYDIDEWELYDLEKDPMQMNNLIHDPGYKDVILNLKEQLATLQLKYGDSHEDAMKLVREMEENKKKK